jgi:hypothetical protein
MIGARRDPTFGPIVMVGLGGVWVEALKDVALRLAPFDEDEARSMLDDLRGRSLISGARGRPAADVGALARLAAGLSRWAAGADWLAELDLNPIIANADGLVIVDARMRVREPSTIANQKWRV